jgi:hypothetical protein
MLTYPYFKPGSQNDRLLRHMMNGKSVTRYEMQWMFRVQNPTARISDIRKRVGDRLLVTEKVDPNGQTYAEYRLARA